MTACSSGSESSSTKSDTSTSSTTSSSSSSTTSSSTTSSSTTSSESSASTESTESSAPEEPEAPAAKEEDFEFTEENGEITITGYKGSDTDLVIPQKIDGKPVTVIGEKAFQRKSLKSVVIPDGVTTIGEYAFGECGELADITIPESVTEFINTSNIYMTPFSGTAWLKNKRAENPLVVVNNTVIDGRTCTRSVEIPEGVKAIGERAFNGCTTITEISIPKSLEKIGSSAFCNCSRLTDIVLPDSVSSIGDFAFYSCTALENVTFPNNTVEMGDRIFGYDDGFNDYTAPWLKKLRTADPIVIINGNLIDASSATGDVIIPDSVKSVAGGSFLGSQISSVKLPEGITEIPAICFEWCANLQNITIPNSVTEIGNYAFNYCSSLTSITIPNNVTKIGDYAFAECFNLTSVTLSNNLKEIGIRAFSDCKLSSITIPDSVTDIGNMAFGSTIKSVTLPDNIKHLGKNVFASADITYRGEIYYPELYNELVADIEANNA